MSGRIETVAQAEDAIARCNHHIDHPWELLDGKGSRRDTSANRSKVTRFYTDQRAQLEKLIAQLRGEEDQ
jgi:hypothetical protein